MRLETDPGWYGWLAGAERMKRGSVCDGPKWNGFAKFYFGNDLSPLLSFFLRLAIPFGLG